MSFGDKSQTSNLESIALRLVGAKMETKKDQYGSLSTVEREEKEEGKQLVGSYNPPKCLPDVVNASKHRKEHSGSQVARASHRKKKPVRPPRIRLASERLGESFSDDGVGIVNLFFDSGSEECLNLDRDCLLDSKPEIAESEDGSGISIMEEETEKQENDSPNSTVVLRPTTCSDVQPIVSISINGEKQANSTSGEDEKKMPPSESIPKKTCLDIKLNVENPPDYSPTPSAADTQPLLLDDGTGESSLRIIGEIILPFLLAGLGCVFAGIVLDAVKVHVFDECTFQEIST